MTVGELEDWLRGLNWQQVEEILPQLQKDPRRGVHNLAWHWQRKIEEKRQGMLRWQELCRREGELREKGYRYVAGIDEAGRGPLAGPVAAAAVILPPDTHLWGLDDSKKLTPRQRRELYREITAKALAWSVGASSPQDIDATDILQATRKAMAEALARLPLPPDYLLIDALQLPGVALPQEGIVGGDGKCACIAAASVIAKVTRDSWMEEWDRRYPGYGFARHKGYPTPEHLEALAKLGPCPLHRRSFQPLATLFPDRNIAGGEVGEDG
ncbi:MAG TPA: ribonuclease HII [Firmicutes bacterium]|nr:ribonuclease HII [Bacillota bacterium]